MKYFWLAYTLFIFFLAVSPCCGDEGQSSATSSSISRIDEHQHDSHVHEVCSPFCTCTNCGCHGCSSDAFQFVDIGLLLQEPSDYRISRYTFQFISRFEATIWQPPRLV